MTELSPAARAVLDAVINNPVCLPFEHDLAAALRTLVDTKATEVSVEGHYRMIVDVEDIHAIADELEAQSPIN